MLPFMTTFIKNKLGHFDPTELPKSAKPLLDTLGIHSGEVDFPIELSELGMQGGMVEVFAYGTAIINHH